MYLVIPSLIVATITISTALIVPNKLILIEYKFAGLLFLTAFHFVLSWFVLRLMIAFKFLEQSVNLLSIETIVLMN
jgi:hypothetical protein